MCSEVVSPLAFYWVVRQNKAALLSIRDNAVVSTDQFGRLKPVFTADLAKICYIIAHDFLAGWLI
jgi:hypothetical protein